MKKMLVSFVLDETGSMSTFKLQTISGFNEYIDTLKKEKNAKDVLFTLTKFNSEKVDTVYNGSKLEDVVHLNEDSYRPNALTPLYDAVGRTIHSLEDKVTGKKQNVLLVIQTDGQENASKEFTCESIFKLIDEKKKLGWTFVFLGADQDAWLASSVMGISLGNTLSYAGAQTISAFTTTARGTSAYVANNGTQTDSYYGDGNSISTAKNPSLKKNKK
jgi:hypothetical protein